MSELLRHSTRSRVLLALALAGLVAACAFAYYFVVFGDVFLLIEYRQWVRGASTPLYVMSFLDYAFSPSTTFTRAFPLLVFGGFADLCGYNIRCHNALNILTLCIAGVFLALTAAQMTRWNHPLLSAGAAAAFFGTVPMLDSITWQGTGLDKIAVLMCSFCVFLYTLYLDQRWSVHAKIGWNCLFGAALVAAYNSKESAWSLLPALLLLGALYELRRTSGTIRQRIHWSIREALLPLILSTAYVGYHAVAYLWNVRADPYMAHAFSGDRWTNLNKFISDLFNNAPISLPAFILLAALFITYSYWRVSDPMSLRLSDALLWSLLSFLLSIFIPSATQYASPFYLLVPSFFCFLLSYLVAVRSLELVSERWRPIVVLILSCALASHLLLFRAETDRYSGITAVSDNFRKLLTVIAATVPAEASTPVHIIYPESVSSAYMYLDPPYNRALQEYIYGSAPRHGRGLDERVTTAAYNDHYRPELKAGAFNFVLGQNMELVYMAGSQASEQQPK